MYYDFNVAKYFSENCNATLKSISISTMNAMISKYIVKYLLLLSNDRHNRSNMNPIPLRHFTYAIKSL